MDRLSQKPKDIDQLFQKKEERLPNSIAKYIRLLKQSEKWEEAIAFRENFVATKVSNRRERAEKELNQTIIELLETNDPAVQANKEVRAVWLMFAAGVLQSDERVKNILEILDSKGGELKQQLEENLPAIRDEIKHLLP